jgi:Lecithin:cholesterol acyltransferase
VVTEPSTPASHSRQAILVTVHGTWARRASWAQADSVLGKAMLHWFAQRQVNAIVSPFEWSGRNAVAARQAAGGALLRHIDDLRLAHPAATVHVVAHSHGGSVLAYALKQRPELREHIAGFVALATPWIDVVPYGYGPALRAMLARLLLYAVFAACLWTVPAAVQCYLQPQASVVQAPAPAASAGTGLPASSVPARAKTQRPAVENVANEWAWFGDIIDALVQVAYSLAIAAGISVLFFVAQRWLARWLGHTLTAFRERTRTFADRASTLRESFPPSVFLKPIGDEAALALTWTSAMAALSQGASATLYLSARQGAARWTRAPVWARWCVGLLLTTAWSLGTVMFTEVRNAGDLLELLDMFVPETIANITGYGALLGFAVFWSFAAWVAAALWLLATLALMLAAWLAAAGSGMATLWAALYLRVSVEAVPAGTRQLVLVDVSGASSAEPAAAARLSHSALYESTSAIEAVLTALEAFERGRHDAPGGAPVHDAAPEPVRRSAAPGSR